MGLFDLYGQTCQICGASCGDVEQHQRWHDAVATLIGEFARQAGIQVPAETIAALVAAQERLVSS